MRQKFKIVDFYPDDYDLPREFFMKAKFASLFFFVFTRQKWASIDCGILNSL